MVSVGVIILIIDKPWLSFQFSRCGRSVVVKSTSIVVIIVVGRGQSRPSSKVVGQSSSSHCWQGSCACERRRCRQRRASSLSTRPEVVCHCQQCNPGRGVRPMVMQQSSLSELGRGAHRSRAGRVIGSDKLWKVGHAAREPAQRGVG